MVNLKINGKAVCVNEGTSILEAAKTVGINIPTLCFLKDINEVGACRVCVVEIEGKDRLVTACNTPVEEGINVLTNSKKAREARKSNVELILSQHDYHCATCVRSGNCALQSVANDLNIHEVPFTEKLTKKQWNNDFPVIREEEKCIKCYRCVNVCEKIQGLGVWKVLNTGSRTTVGIEGGKDIASVNCAACGQCITHCPVGALHERDDVDKVLEALEDPKKVTVIQIAPAVRAAWGEAFDITREEATVKKLVACMRKAGFDYIFDTNFTADLTIMEEGTEFLTKLTKDPGSLPLFTSCCPGWIRFIKSEFPELLAHVSTTKSPQQMFGAVAKSYFAEKIGVDPKDMYCVSIMPCTAKKFECSIPVMNDACGDPDVDVVLTTREITRLLKVYGVDVPATPEEEFDSPLGVGTGAAVIFGATGGVMEAALRTAYFVVVGENPPLDAFKDVRGLKGWKEATYDVKGIPVRVAIASGLGNTRNLLNAVKKGEVAYDFIEIMACPGGCAGGGGQPIEDGCELAGVRGENLYGLDDIADLRFSHENPEVNAVYAEYFEAPNSHKAHTLLHTDHFHDGIKDYK